MICIAFAYIIIPKKKIIDFLTHNNFIPSKKLTVRLNKNSNTIKYDSSSIVFYSA
jgi:hypothetical protein